MKYQRNKSSTPGIRIPVAPLVTIACAIAVMIAWCIAMTATIARAASSAAPAKQLADLPEAVTSFGAIVSGDHLYVYGGHTGQTHEYSIEGVSGRFHRLNLREGGKWEELASGPALQGAGMAAYDGKVYRAGGMTAKNKEGDPGDLYSTDSVARFDPNTGKWEELTPLPEARSSHEIIVLGHNLYIIGGWTLAGESVEGKWLNTTWVTDLREATLTWRKLPDAPFQRRAVSLAAVEGKLVVIGGLEPKGGTTGAVSVLDTKANKWSDGPDFPAKQRFKGFGSAAIAVDGVVYASGWEGHVQALDVSAMKWRDTPLATLGHARFFHRLVAHGNTLVALGGGHKVGHIPSLERITLKHTD
ncbi:MAG: hypothetical protein WD768_07190 [Phycisphaeraceae bacterium]